MKDTGIIFFYKWVISIQSKQGGSDECLICVERFPSTATFNPPPYPGPRYFMSNFHLKLNSRDMGHSWGHAIKKRGWSLQPDLLRGAHPTVSPWLTLALMEQDWQLTLLMVSPSSVSLRQNSRPLPNSSIIFCQLCVSVHILSWCFPALSYSCSSLARMGRAACSKD